MSTVHTLTRTAARQLRVHRAVVGNRITDTGMPGSLLVVLVVIPDRPAAA